MTLTKHVAPAIDLYLSPSSLWKDLALRTLLRVEEMISFLIDLAEIIQMLL